MVSRCVGQAHAQMADATNDLLLMPGVALNAALLSSATLSAGARACSLSTAVGYTRAEEVGPVKFGTFPPNSPTNKSLPSRVANASACGMSNTRKSG